MPVSERPKALFNVLKYAALVTGCTVAGANFCQTDDLLHLSSLCAALGVPGFVGFIKTVLPTMGGMFAERLGGRYDIWRDHRRARTAPVLAAEVISELTQEFAERRWTGRQSLMGAAQSVISRAGELARGEITEKEAAEVLTWIGDGKTKDAAAEEVDWDAVVDALFSLDRAGENKNFGQKAARAVFGFLGRKADGEEAITDAKKGLAQHLRENFAARLDSKLEREAADDTAAYRQMALRLQTAVLDELRVWRADSDAATTERDATERQRHQELETAIAGAERRLQKAILVTIAKIPQRQLSEIADVLKTLQEGDAALFAEVRKVLAGVQEVADAVAAGREENRQGFAEQREAFARMGEQIASKENNYLLPAREAERSRNIPDTTIYGREVEMAAVREALRSGGAAGVTQAITGLGGIGKTALAFGYAKAHRHDYEFVFYLNASSVAAARESYRELAEQLGLAERGHPDLNVVADAVKHEIAGLTNYLLILDNADFGAGYAAADLKPHLPPRNGSHWLVTSRTAGDLHGLGVPRGAVRRLTELAPDASVRLLWETVQGEGARIAEGERETLAELARTLEYFPLALAQAAAYIGESAGDRVVTEADYAAYRRLYAGAVRALPEPPSHADEGDEDAQKYRKVVNTTWHVNLDAIRKSGGGASVALFTLSAFLAPDDIPLEVTLAASRRAIPERAGAYRDAKTPEDVEIAFQNLIFPLTRYGLATRDDGKRAYSVHRLVQRVVRDALTADERREWLEKAAQTLYDAFPGSDFEHWPVCARLTPHIQALQPQLERAQLENESVASLYNDTGIYLQAQGRYAEAENAYGKALEIFNTALPPGHVSIGNVWNNLGIVYEAQGRYTEAENAYGKALVIKQEALPPGHVSIGNTWNNLGGVYQLQGRYPEAENAYGKALEIFNTALPPNHPYLKIVSENIQRLREHPQRSVVALPETFVGIVQKRRKP